MHGGEQTHMLVFFDRIDCAECRKHATVIQQLVDATQGAPKIARSFCDLSAQHFCGAIQADNIPGAFLIEQKAIYELDMSEGLDFDKAMTFINDKTSRGEPLTTNIERHVREGEIKAQKEKESKMSNQ